MFLLGEPMSDADRKNGRQSGKAEPKTTAAFGSPVARVGGQIGSYKLLSTLGEGGFAIVYLAEQERPVNATLRLTG
ncbi:MAG: hypothetical protein U9Q07_02925, partial [Planctomycetota bacterium]|nr:hypothetical protein [Planctomycetota bacterium]